MAKRKNENSYQNDPKRFTLPLPDFSVPPPGFNSAPSYNPQGFQSNSNWFTNPAQQQNPYGYYNYTTSDTPSYASPSTFFWTPNKPRTFPNAPTIRPMSIQNLKNRGRGRGRAPGRGNDAYLNKSPRSSSSTSAVPQWFQQNSINTSNASPRFANSSYSGDNDRPSESGSATVSEEKNESKKTIVNKKGKRKSMSQKYSSKPWDLESAEKAVAVELEYNRLQNTQSLILKFPDAELNKEIVKSFNSNIEHVHFQQPSTPRYCFVQLCEGADVDTVQNQLRDVAFGGGKIIVEKKINQKSKELAPEKIDPYTLYVGNLPTNITAETVKAIYPTAFRVDIGYAQKMKYTRYAFISYQSAEAAIKAFKETHSLSLESRSIIVRFRRHKGAVGLPGQSKTPGHLGEEATNSKIQGSNNEVKVKKTSISLTDDGVDLHDGPMEIDEDDYDIPYHDDLDDQYNSDFDDSLLDNISPNKESKKLIRDELPINRNLNTSHKGSSVPKPTKSMAKKDSSITVFEDPKKSKTNEPNASEAAKKNVEQKLGEILPNVLTQLLNSNEIKQEPFEKEYVEQLLQNQFVPEFASQLAAMAMGAIKSEPLVAELLLRKKPGKVPMPILCADEIKTEPVEQTDHEVTIPNLIPKTETPDSDDQDDFTDDYTNQRSTRRFREPMYKRLQKFKRYRPDNIPVNITQPEEPIEDFDMSYILDYISEEQAQFEELNKETTIHTTNYITSSFRPKSDETTSNMNNSSNVSTSQGFEISDTSSKLATAAFETSSPLLIRLPLAKPNEANTVESSSVSDSSCHLSSSLGTSLETKNQANIGATSPTKTPPPIGKPTAAVSPLITITDTQLAANLSSDNSLLSGRSSINSSQLSSISSSSTRLASQNVRTSISTGSSFLSSTTAHSVGTPVAVNSPVAAVSPLSHTNCDLSSNSGPSHMKNSNYSLTSLISGYNLPGNSSHIMSLLERSQHVSVSPNNSRSIKISNVVRNTKTKGLSAVISPQLPARSAAQSSKSTSNVLGSVYSQDKQSKVNISFDDFSEDEEDNTDYVALLGAPPPNLDDFINKT